MGVALVAGLGRIPLRAPWTAVTLPLVAGCLFGLGVWTAGEAEKFFGRVDPGQVVIDEVVGQIVTFLGHPRPSWKLLIAGFVLFRILDVIKPFPARRAEHARAGWGIMWDDVVAGAYALAGVVLLGYVFK